MDKQEPKSRVDETHGGTLVQAIAPGELKSFNDAECQHEKLIRDDSEPDFNTFICANNRCSEVFMFAKE